ASPRASIAFLQASRALALLNGRTHVLPEDIRSLRHLVLRHRVLLTFEADAEGVRSEEIIDQIFASVPTPCRCTSTRSARPVQATHPPGPRRPDDHLDRPGEEQALHPLVADV